MLQIYIPEICKNEAEWICSILLGEFLCLEFVTVPSPGTCYSLRLNGKQLELPNIFFAKAGICWLKPESLPVQPLAHWDTRELGLNITDVVEPLLPVLYGTPGCQVNQDHIRLEVDIFGSTFFMLSRYEEVVKLDRDKHNRFPATASLAYQEGFLHRPIVNEYLEILWACINYLWSGFRRKSREFRMFVTADVDHPYSCGTKNPVRQIKQVGEDLIKWRNPKRAVCNAINYFKSKSGDFSFDHYYSRFDWMMDINEAAGNTMLFHFIAGHSDPEMSGAYSLNEPIIRKLIQRVRGSIDGCYSLDEPIIRKLIRRIRDRGHDIGLHPSYNAYRDAEQLHREADNLRRVMGEENIEQDNIGSRQHYLRWETPTTAQHLVSAGIAYDSTLSFADHAGFRCGTCYPYTFFDLAQRKALNLKEVPLVVMECSVIEEQYMGLGYSEKSFDTMKRYKDVCKKFNGDFVMLWHNSSFDCRRACAIYSELITN